MALQPIPIAQTLETNQRLRQNGQKKVPVVKTPKSPEVKYRKQINALIRSLKNDVNTLIVPLLRQLEPEYVTDSVVISDDYADELQRAFLSLRRRYEGINRQAQIVSTEFVNGIDQKQRERFINAIDQAVGVDLNSIIARENLGPTLKASINENVNLITSIPEEYFKQIETAVCI